MADSSSQILKFGQAHSPKPSTESSVPTRFPKLRKIFIDKNKMEVHKRLLSELEAMGFSEAQVMNALCSGSSSIEAAINWIVDHENDTEPHDMPMVPIDIISEASTPFHISGQVKLRAQALRNQAGKMNAEQEKKLEREREKERIRAGKELLEAKRILEESERKRFLAQRKAEKEEERRAREKVRQELHQDKLERQRMLGLPRDGSTSVKPVIPLVQKTTNLPSVDSTLVSAKPVSEREQMRNCLRSLKRRSKEDNSNATRAFQTLLIYVKNVVNHPDEGRFRMIRTTNPAFQERVGKFEEGIKFLELCGFERVDGGRFLFLPKKKVDMSALKLAGTELQNALTNPFFGLVSG